MGLFDQIISAIDNPNQQASSSQLATILGTVQQLTNSYGIEPAAVHSVLSIVGNYVGSALQQKQNIDGEEQAQAVVNQYSGTYPNPQAVHTLFSPEQQEQVAQDAAQQTGLSIGTIQQMLPIVVPLVLNLLHTGGNQNPGQGFSNPVLTEFLAAAQGGNVNIAEVLQLAGKYLSR